MVTPIQSIHIEAVGQNQKHEYDDAPLVGEPETQGIARARQLVLIEPVGYQDAATQPGCGPGQPSAVQHRLVQHVNRQRQQQQSQKGDLVGGNSQAGAPGAAVWYSPVSLQ